MNAAYNSSEAPSLVPPPPPLEASRQRRAFPIQPPSLSTAVQSGHLNPQTPASSVSARSPFSASATTPMTSITPRGTSPMAPRNVTPYNPQEWNRNGPVGGSYRPHSVQTAASRAVQGRDATGYESNLPSPPPPYSATPTSPSPHSTSFHPLATSQTNSPATATDMLNPNTYSPSMASRQFSSPTQAYTSPGSAIGGTSTQLHASFPPPPPPGGERDRSTSRSRFNLSMLASRNRQSTSNAMEMLQNQTMEALARAPTQSGQWSGPAVDVLPPGSRRAASTGAIGTGLDQHRFTPEQIVSGGSPQSRQSGFTVPPPPPGPPPGSRTQSLTRGMSRTSSSSQVNNVGSNGFTTAGSSRPAAASIARLGPIPPTPADWVDVDANSNTRRQKSTTPPVDSISHPQELNGIRQASRPPSRFDEVIAAKETSVLSSDVPNHHGLQRSETTTMGIRERRNASKARTASKEPQSATEPQTAPWDPVDDVTKPANLVLQSSEGALNRRRRVSKAKISPLFNKSPQSLGAPDSGNKIDSAMPNGESTTPSSARRTRIVDTPPFSSGSEPAEQFPKIDNASSPRPYAYPPTPLEKQNGFGSQPTSASANGTDFATSVQPSSLTSFSIEARERHRVFLEREAGAETDLERLELFAEFIVNESRLRRDRYSEAFDSLGSDVLDLTRDLWRSYTIPKRNKTPVAPPETDRKTPLARIITNTTAESEGTPVSSNASQNATYTPRTDMDSPTAAFPPRRDLQRQNSYQPMLSPIPSMAMSTVPDEDDSRGRPSSRWWEASTGPPSAGGTRKVERSKRESKYMGVSKEIRENPQWDDVQQSPLQNSAGPSQPYSRLGPNEYPPEKVGWHEQSDYGSIDATVPPPPPPPPGPPPNQRIPVAPRMDLSRLITLPPPYPRHHPALNNNHPELAAIRATLSKVNSQGEAADARAKHQELMQLASPKVEPEAAIIEKRKQLRAQIQQKVNNGTISFAEAANEEAEFDKTETNRNRAAAQKEFDTFQSQVMGPVIRVFQEKLNSASVSIDQLRGSLADDARSSDPNRAQEEGDEKPELLEKITLMKWFFEAREQLHRDLYNLEGESDERYKQVILTPYRIAGNQDKINEVESFFNKDALDRRVKFEQKALKRFEDFLQTVEKSVMRGVELQLSAFWDIAPSLLEVVQKVPSNLDDFEIFIPGQEYDENPSYHQFPMQYLFTLLLHARRSAYQFIESQTNLLCLLHEAKTGVMTAGCRLLEVQRRQNGEDKDVVKKEMAAIKTDEDARLTSDLKERVQLVEEQWRQALGKGIEECETRVECYLVEQNGWEDGLRD